MSEVLRVMVVALAAAVTSLSVSSSAEAQEAIERDASDLDTSGIELFWEAADRLATGDQLNNSDWDAFFSHPGYAVTEASGQRRSVITHCMVAVFSPDGDLEMAKENLPDGEGRRDLVGRTCDHIATIAESRREISDYLAELRDGDLAEAGKQAAARYLPAGVTENTEAPKAYVLLFEAQGFGRDDAIVMDALLMMTLGEAHNVQFLGHELHHGYRDAVANQDPAPEAAPLFWALDGIVNEGIASMVDKAEYIRTGSIPQGFPPVFLDLVAQAPERLSAIDEALATLDPTADGYAAAADIVRQSSPWGGHLNGVYMAMAIEEAFGREAVVEAITGPVAFFARYQRAAEHLDGDYFRFSETAMGRIAALGSS